MINQNCEFCQGTGFIDVLNIWSMQRARVEYGEVSYDSFEALPILKNVQRCFKCHGTEAAEDDMKALRIKMGGDPFDEKTFA